MAYLLWYMIVKQAFEYKTKDIYLQTQPNRGIHLSTSEKNMQNFILQV